MKQRNLTTNYGSMGSQELKQRSIKDDTDNLSSFTDVASDKDKSSYHVRSRQDQKIAMAKRGLRSLGIAVFLPVSLNLLSIYLGSTSTRYGYGSLSKPFWFPPMWALHLACLASNFLMGVSAWLVWAGGGFHWKPAAIWLYLAHLLLVLVWESIVFGAGARSWIGLIVCSGMLGTSIACSRIFNQVNSTAGNLMKPCMAWTAFLFVVNLKLALL